MKGPSPPAFGRSSTAKLAWEQRAQHPCWRPTFQRHVYLAHHSLSLSGKPQGRRKSKRVAAGARLPVPYPVSSELALRARPASRLSFPLLHLLCRRGFVRLGPHLAATLQTPARLPPRTARLLGVLRSSTSGDRPSRYLVPHFHPAPAPARARAPAPAPAPGPGLGWWHSTRTDWL